MTLCLSMFLRLVFAFNFAMIMSYQKFTQRRLFSARQLSFYNREPTTENSSWTLKPVGLVRSKYYNRYGVPKQATIIARNDSQPSDGRLVVFPEFRECITSLDGFDYIWVITMMHLNSGFKKLIQPQPVLECETDIKKIPKSVGLFASRAPHRPNPIALSALKVVSVNVAEGFIDVRGLDLLDDTPILDIKPYIPAFDSFEDAKAGWMDLIRSNVSEARVKGYQTIYSPRGARSTRAGLRKKEAEANLLALRASSLIDDHASSQNSTSATINPPPESKI